jgi:drug/metabolite transporter (DMT)-like permease
MASGLQMLLGSVALFVEAGLTGEFGRFRPEAVSASSLWALVYLTLIGSLIAFNAYAWLLRNAPLSLVGTYAYVNPVVAVALGSIILAEPVTPRTLVASTVIVVAVAMIVTARGRMARRGAAPAVAEPGATTDTEPTAPPVARASLSPEPASRQ